MMTTLKSSLVSLSLVVSACGDPATSPQRPAVATPVATPAEPAKTPAPASAGAPAEVAAPAEITEAKGVDLALLSDAQKTSFFRILNSEASACDKPHSLAVSLRDDASCRDSLIVAQYIADGLAAGASASDLKASIEPLVDTLRPRAIDIEGRPVHGDPAAKVTVVVFADFECTHCRQEAPVLRQAIDRSQGKVKLVYKHFPLTSNLRSKAAAIATVAAMEQGKFWEMHDMVFAHQTALQDADLRGYARKIGLDMAKFDASYAAKRGQALVEADRAEGEKLKISGTPAVYVDGRRMHGSLFGGTLAGWIDDALRRDAAVVAEKG